ncbi:MAG: glycosyltransferase family 9 protein [Saprospiraceae bacterium]|nr:glycosyltransferase family 9 protein [Saprospiraceae bacterium]
MKKVLIIRFSSIGDIVLTTPIIRCLHQQLNVDVHVLTKSTFATLLATNPYVGKVHTFSTSVKQVLQTLKEEEFDLVIDLHKNVRSWKVRRALKCRSISFDKLNLQKWLLTRFKIDMLPQKHIVDRYFEAIRGLGVQNDGAGLDYFVSKEDQVDPQRWVKGPYLVVVLGAAHATKQMPVDLLVSILEHVELPVLLLGGPGDILLGQAVLEQFNRPNLINLAGELSLGGSADIIRQAAGVLTPDTGMMHISAAFRKPIVSVWGNTVPAFGMYPYMPGPEVREKRFEVDGLSCRPCSKIGFDKCPKGHFQCMRRQPAAEIAQTLADFANNRI